MARPLRKRGVAVGTRHRGNFKPKVKLNPSMVRDLRGKTHIRGGTLRSVKHLKRGR
jgi:hypothetical protein